MLAIKLLTNVLCALTLVISFCLVTGASSAQELDTEALSPQLQSPLRFQHLTSDDGLAQNTVYAIMQDRNGFMWFGTEGGLSRYDGYDFLTFEADANAVEGMQRDHINALMEDDTGRIWIATDGGGVLWLDPHTLEIRNMFLEPVAGEAPPIRDSRVRSLFQDSSGNIWFGSNNMFGLSRMNPATATFDNYLSSDDRENNISGSLFLDIIETDDAKVWFAAGRSVDRFDLATEAFTNFPLDQGNNSRAIHQDQYGVFG